MISKHVRRPWPDEVKEALEKFRQGDLIDRPPFFYGHGADVRLWQVVDGEVNGDATVDDSGASPGRDSSADPLAEDPDAVPSAVEELHPDDGPPFGIVTTQTCDLDEQGRFPLQPWIQVSPVYKLEGTKEEQDQFAAKQFVYEVNSASLPQGRWVADLRIEMPLEKSLLANREPIRAFATEADADLFAHQLGRRRARAALANKLVENVIALVRARRGKSKGMWKNQVFRLMLEIEGGTRLAPAAVRLHVIAEQEPTEEIRSFFDDWEDEAREPAGEVDIELWATEYHDARSISLRDYDRWIELNLP